MLGLFSGKKPDHPLADAKEAKRLLGELPGKEPAAALDDAAAWLETLTHAEGFRPEQRFQLVAQIDETVILHARRLARDYATAGRVSRIQELKLRQAGEGYWTALATAYGVCLDEANAAGKAGESLRAGLLPLRLLHASTGRLKWLQYHYGPVPADLWGLAGSAYLAATAAGAERRAQAVYAGAESSVAREYLRLLVCQASSMDSLMPREIEIADYLVAHFLPYFVLTAEVRPDNVYWADAAKPVPPARLARLPEVTPSLRFFNTGAAAELVADLRGQANAAGAMPAGVNLGGQYPLEAVLPVLDHLAACWAPTPPMRGHVRHRVKSRLAVVNGLEAINRTLVVPERGGEGAEAWIVDDVSQGGLGAQVALGAKDWLRVGALLAMQPEGGSNWLIGIVRRFARLGETSGAVGIETLSKAPRAAIADCGGLIADIVVLDEPQPGTILRALLPDAAWEAHVPVQFSCDGRILTLRPAGVVERGADYVVGRYTLAA